MPGSNRTFLNLGTVFRHSGHRSGIYRSVYVCTLDFRFRDGPTYRNIGLQ